VIVTEKGERRSRHARGLLAKINRREALSLSLSSLTFNGREGAPERRRCGLSGVHLRSVANVTRHVEDTATKSTRARATHSRRVTARLMVERADARSPWMRGCVRARVRRVIKERPSPPRDHRRRRFVEDWSVTGWEVLFQRRRFLSTVAVAAKLPDGG